MLRVTHGVIGDTYCVTGGYLLCGRRVSYAGGDCVVKAETLVEARRSQSGLGAAAVAIAAAVNPLIDKSNRIIKPRP